MDAGHGLVHTRTPSTHKLKAVIHTKKKALGDKKELPKLPLSLFCVNYLLLGTGPALKV